MNSRIISTLTVAVALALPVAGAAALGADTQAAVTTDTPPGADVHAEADADAEVGGAAAAARVRVSVAPGDPHVTDAPATAAHRPAPRHADTERSSEQPERETFVVHDAGEVTVTWVPDAILEVEVHPAEGWRHRLHREDRRTARVGLTDGSTGYLFSAHVTDDGRLHTAIAAREAPRDPRPEATTETFDVGEAGTVTLTYSRRGIHQVEVDAREGWRHRVHRDDDRRTVHVGFTDGDTAYLFTAHVAEDGRLRTHVARRDRGEGPTIQDGVTPSNRG